MSRMFFSSFRSKIQQTTRAKFSTSATFGSQSTRSGSKTQFSRFSAESSTTNTTTTSSSRFTTNTTRSSGTKTNTTSQQINQQLQRTEQKAAFEGMFGTVARQSVVHFKSLAALGSLAQLGSQLHYQFSNTEATDDSMNFYEVNEALAYKSRRAVMGTPFWNSTLRQFNPIAILNSKTREAAQIQIKNYALHNLLRPKGILSVAAVYGGLGWVYGVLYKNRYHQSYEYH